LGVIWSSRTGN